MSIQIDIVRKNTYKCGITQNRIDITSYLYHTIQEYLYRESEYNIMQIRIEIADSKYIFHITKRIHIAKQHDTYYSK